MATHIYVGPWINWTDGAIRGATITVTSRAGGLLISFIATFVTVVGAQLWRILSYLFHQIRASDHPQDGLHHQQQNILRNASTPGSAAWSFLQQSWYWRRRVSLVFLRTIPWALFSFIYLILFTVLATFSSEVSEAAGRARMLRSGNCGYWQADDPPAELSIQAYNQKMANESIVSSTYARACYGGNSATGQCGAFPVPALTWTADGEAECPFDEEMCVGKPVSAFRMTTEKIDSHHHLGINARPENRIQFRKQTTCSPLVQQRTPVDGDSNVPGMGMDGDTLLEYYYGSVGAEPNVISNFSWRYNTHSYIDNFGWVTWALMSYAPHDPGNGYSPIAELRTEKADISIIFVAANSVRFAEMCEDPVFGAHYIDNNTAPNYATDEYVVPIACAETYQICNPNNDQCTPFVGSRQLLNLTVDLGIDLDQMGAASRVAMAAMFTSIYTQTYTRRSGSLRAEETVASLLQFPLPNNQWQIEVSGWFDTGLSRLQHELQAYASRPSNVVEGSHLWQPGDDVSLAMCDTQMINDDGSTTSFSVLGLIVIFVIGGIIILTSLVLDTVVGWLQSLLKIGEYKKMNWVLDDKLQLQRMLLEGVGHGHWKGATSFPVTTSKGEFGGWKDIDVDHPTLIPRSAGTTSSSVRSAEAIPNDDGNKMTDVFMREMRS